MRRFNRKGRLYARMHKFFKVHNLLKRILSIRMVLGKRRRLNRKKLAALHLVVFQVAFGLLLAILGHLEGSAIKKCAEWLCSTLVGRQE